LFYRENFAIAIWQHHSGMLFLTDVPAKYFTQYLDIHAKDLSS